MSLVDDQAEAQRAANASALPHFDAFREHRERLTALVCRGVQAASEQRLCVLGAGNAYDLDLARLAQHFREIHLVDLDAAALAGARERQSEADRGRIALHAPVDVAAALDKLDRWVAGDVTPDELLRYPADAVRDVAGRVGTGFDVVLSACMLTQIQLSVLHAFGDTHRLFEAVRQSVTLAHLRLLAELAAPGGRAIFATDVSSQRIFPLRSVARSPRLTEVLKQLVRAGHVFHVANPDLIRRVAADDPVLKGRVALSNPLDVWLWQNGPDELFLVYALELRRRR